MLYTLVELREALKDTQAPFEVSEDADNLFIIFQN